MSQINSLVIKARQGDFESMEHILQCFKPKVTAICREYFLIGSDFDDILQEGMIGLYKAVVGYNVDKNDNFASFAAMCVHHQIQNAVKIANSKRNQPLNNYISISVDGGITASEDSPKIMLEADDKCAEQLSLDKERERILYKKVKDVLTNLQYNILLMYLNGYSYIEMAVKHGITNKNIDNHIQAIKRKLRALLKGGE